jgi:hypothetical protein
MTKVRPLQSVSHNGSNDCEYSIAGDLSGCDNSVVPPIWRIKQISAQVWLVSFMQYDLGFFDQETDRVTSAENPFGAKVLGV